MFDDRADILAMNVHAANGIENSICHALMKDAEHIKKAKPFKHEIYINKVCFVIYSPCIVTLPGGGESAMWSAAYMDPRAIIVRRANVAVPIFPGGDND